MAVSREQIVEMDAQVDKAITQVTRMRAAAKAAVSTDRAKDNHQPWSFLQAKLDLLAHAAIAARDSVRLIGDYNRAAGIDD